MEEKTREKCKEKVFDGWHHHRCSRWAIKDGYCKQHHPDEVEKRQEQKEKRWKRKWGKDPLRVAFREIERLRSEKEELLEALKQVEPMASSLMDELTSKKATNWGIVNDCLIAVKKVLAGVAKKGE